MILGGKSFTTSVREFMEYTHTHIHVYAYISSKIDKIITHESKTTTQMKYKTMITEPQK